MNRFIKAISATVTIISLLAIGFLLAGCSGGGGDAPAVPAKEVRALTATEQSLVQSDNGFGLKLFQEVAKAQTNQNIFISPLSVAMALGMTYNGANGTTQQAMQATLNMDGQTLPEVNASYKSLLDLLATLDPKVIFQIANSIWYREGFTAEKDFVGLNKTYFNAEVNALDFNAPTAVDTINAWVNKGTNGKIPTILEPPIDPLTMMYLINAIYFKGSWASRFNPANTRDYLFTLLDGSKKTCKMMSQTRAFKDFGNADFSAIDLPYGDGDFSMTIFLPQVGKTPDDLIANFNQANWNQWIQTLSARTAVEVGIALPKFTLKYELKLKDALTALEMGVAFAPFLADFTKINKEGGLYINEVKHKTYVEVNEEGTEAAAVTSVEVVEISSRSPRSLLIDRPFVFAIRETRSQTILFLGKIVDPTLP